MSELGSNDNQDAWNTLPEGWRVVRRSSQRAAAVCGACGSAATAGPGKGGWRATDGSFFCTACWSCWRDGHDPESDYGAWLQSNSGAPSMKLRFCLDYAPTKRQREQCLCCDSSGTTRNGTPWDAGRGATSWWGMEDADEHLPAEAGSDGEEEELEFRHLTYCDAHCHLDYCLLNEKLGTEMWTFKKWLCNDWQEGWCPSGKDCPYAHGEHELWVRKPLEDADLQAFANRHSVDPPSSGAGYVSAGRLARGACASCGELVKSRRRIAVNGVEFCSVEHLSDYASQLSSPSMQKLISPSGRRGPRLECIIQNCCEKGSISDTCTLVAAAERLLGGAVFCTFGCHPHNYLDYGDALEQDLLQALRQSGPKAVGWGECGLDYYKNFYDAQQPEKRARMIEVFARQSRLAASLALPLVVHSRDAEADTLAVLHATLPREHRVHIHAFQGSVSMMKEVLDAFPNAVMGMSGAITFKHVTKDVVELARQCPLSRLVLETDAPYLSGEPRDIPRIARAVARIKGLSASEVLRACNANCKRLYNLEGRISIEKVGGEVLAWSSVH